MSADLDALLQVHIDMARRWRKRPPPPVPPPTTPEEWRDIPGYEGIYQASDWGRVRQLRRSGKSNGNIRVRRYPRMLRQWRQSTGHMSVAMAGSRMYVHRAVLLAFRGPPPEGKPHGAHTNGRPTDNRLSNLRWASAQENQHDRRQHGTLKSVLNEGAVRDIRRRYEDGETAKALAAQYEVTAKTINDVVRRRAWVWVE